MRLLPLVGTLRCIAGIGAFISAFAAWSQTSPGPALMSAIAIVGQKCAACHGRDGNSLSPEFPSLARQGATYIERQLHGFRSQEGTQHNGIMGAMALGLSDADIAALGQYFSDQKPRNVEHGDSLEERALGRKLYFGGDSSEGVPACASCHGANAQGLAPEFPRLAGQHPRYTSLQLREFRSGSRSGDMRGMMRAVASGLTDVQVESVSEYLATLQ